MISLLSNGAEACPNGMTRRPVAVMVSLVYLQMTARKPAVDLRFALRQFQQNPTSKLLGPDPPRGSYRRHWTFNALFTHDFHYPNWGTSKLDLPLQNSSVACTPTHLILTATLVLCILTFLPIITYIGRG
ncbi:hypothetical protein SCLCIDRAFT_1043263 [Scleroderma citrinum Foug A]|uniref:Uncharacterized protein n=1 Tax=Scleroderma citrinum Foug A TaxID=1036808 RepID=A0A0C3DEC6_9AGAM|nr:hypothetical protein SCLCIDRAFT_1043263 [Scleroderma citrinum Foug A]